MGVDSVHYIPLRKWPSSGYRMPMPYKRTAGITASAFLLPIAILGIIYFSTSEQLPPDTTALQQLRAAGMGLDTMEGMAALQNLRAFNTVSHTFMTAVTESEPWTIGPCYRHSAQLSMPSGLCEPLHCLRSPLYPSVFVDVWFKAMTVHNTTTGMESCSEATGGQVKHVPTDPVQVSFIVTFKDKLQMTMQCLLELFRTAREAQSVEFVVVSDGSTTDISDVVEFGKRIMFFFGVPFKLVKNAESVGYGAANNIGAQQATGKYIVLLNNDAFVSPGWLYALLKTMQTVPQVGIAGPLFITSRGTIMEAGGLVYADAKAANYGRGSPPDHRHLYSRPVDYISAACAMMERRVFLQLHGFDAAYQRGYWEDTDLAFAVSALGYSIQYQPLAIVVHEEGGSLSAEKEALMLKNQKIFQAKWRSKLEVQHCPSTEPYDMAAVRLTGAYRILWVDDIVPEPDRDSGSIRTYNILMMLRKFGFAISYQATTARDSKYAAQARFNGIEVLPVTPPSSWVLQHDGICLYDAIFIARFYIYEATAQYVHHACRLVPIIFDTVDIHFLREARMALSSRRRWDFSSTDLAHVETWLQSIDPQAKDAALREQRELKAIAESSVTIVVSEQEVKLLQRLVPQAAVKVITNVHNIDGQHMRPHDCQKRQGLLFVGNFNHQPNLQALEALVQDVLPELYESMPASMRESLVLNIVGSNQQPKINLEHAQVPIIYHGWLSDQQLQLLYSTVKVVVAPLMSGAGVKGKINQAMLFGVPVVATPVAAEGMYLKNEENAMLASTPGEFAQKLLKVYADCELWEKIVIGGFDNIRKYFSMQAAASALREVLAEVQLTAPANGSRCY